MGAFAEYLGCERLENASTCALPRAHGSPAVRLTCGAAHLFVTRSSGGAGGSGAPPSQSAVLSALTLPDGRLNVGTHLPLLVQRYRYLSILGEGVSCQVLLAEDVLFPGRLVTVKVMKRQHAHAGQREARTLRFLHSRTARDAAPGIVRLLGTFMLGAHFCLVTERLFPRLLDWVVDSALAPRCDTLRALRKLALQLLSSLAFLHRCGVVHADIKPDNVLMKAAAGAAGVGVALIDFGGAFSVTETNMHAVVAEVQTLPYRAPEVRLFRSNCLQFVVHWHGCEMCPGQLN